ncbi:MAG: sulfatase-like hydrolase/transferase [Subdoligranulum sp.]
MEQPKDQPFFAVLSVFPPHNPYLAPEQFAEGLCAENIKLRSNVPNVPWVKQQAQRELAGYYAMVRNLDWNVGRLVQALDKLNLADDTYIVFFSDHGDMHGSHGWFRKTNPYEESCRCAVHHLYRAQLHVQRGTGAFVRCQQRLPVRCPAEPCGCCPHHPGLVRAAVPDWMQGYDYSGYVTGKPLPPQEPDSAYLQCNEVTGHLNSTAEPWRGIVTREGWKARCPAGRTVDAVQPER